MNLVFFWQWITLNAILLFSLLTAMTLLSVIEKTIDNYFALCPRVKPAQLLAKKALLIAHRGAHQQRLGILENTLPAFSRALALGCFGIELDVQITADGVFVVHHDPHLARLWQKEGMIKELPLSRLQQLAPEIPTLAQVVNDYGKHLHLFIELKVPLTREASLMEVLSPLEPCIDYHLLSLSDALFTSLRSFSPEVFLLVAGHNNLNRFCDLSIKKHYGGVLGHYLLMTQAKIRELQAHHQAVGVGFVDSKFSLYRELNRGLQWIFSNNVACLKSCLNALQ